MTTKELNALKRKMKEIPYPEDEIEKDLNSLTVQNFLEIFRPSEKIVLASRGTKKGKPYVAHCCTKCGRVWFSSKEENCTCDGEKGFLLSISNYYSYYRTLPWSFLLEKTDEYIILAVGKISINLKHANPLPEKEFITKEEFFGCLSVELTPQKQYLVSADPERGTRFYNPDSRTVYRKAPTNQYVYLKNSWFLNQDSFAGISLENIMEAVTKFSLETNSKDNKKPIQRIAANLETHTADASSYLETIKKDLANSNLRTIADEGFGGERTYGIYCGKCKTIHNHVAENESELYCPNCGNRIGYVGSSTSKKYCFLELMDDSTILFRIFYGKWSFNESGNLSVSTEIKEKVRLWAAEKSIQAYIPVCNSNSEISWEKIRFSEIKSDLLSLNWLQRPEDLIALFDKSILKEFHIPEVCKLDKIDAPENIHIELDQGSYIYKIYKIPGIKILSKAGLVSIIDSGFVSGNISGKTPEEILGVSTKTVAAIKEYGLNYKQAHIYEQMIRIDEHLTYDDFLSVSEEKDPHKLLEIKRSYGINYADSLAYLDFIVKDNCIPRLEALGIWFYYLRKCKELSYDFSDKTIIFPDSLKLAADRASYAVSNMDNF